MSNNYTAANIIINKAIEEAGLSEKEVYRIDILSSENGLLEFIIETEWSYIECFGDLESTMVLGLMTTHKTAEELLGNISGQLLIYPQLTACMQQDKYNLTACLQQDKCSLIACLRHCMQQDKCILTAC